MDLPRCMHMCLLGRHICRRNPGVLEGEFWISIERFLRIMQNKQDQMEQSQASAQFPGTHVRIW
jgi:hypothetical protein